MPRCRRHFQRFPSSFVFEVDFPPCKQFSGYSKLTAGVRCDKTTNKTIQMKDKFLRCSSQALRTNTTKHCAPNIPALLSGDVTRDPRCRQVGKDRNERQRTNLIPRFPSADEQEICGEIKIAQEITFLLTNKEVPLHQTKFLPHKG